MKCANFLHTNGSILLKRKSILSFLLRLIYITGIFQNNIVIKFFLFSIY